MLYYCFISAILYGMSSSMCRVNINVTRSCVDFVLAKLFPRNDMVHKLRPYSYLNINQPQNLVHLNMVLFLIKHFSQSVVVYVPRQCRIMKNRKEAPPAEKKPWLKCHRCNVHLCQTCFDAIISMHKNAQELRGKAAIVTYA